MQTIWVAAAMSVYNVPSNLKGAEKDDDDNEVILSIQFKVLVQE